MTIRHSSARQRKGRRRLKRTFITGLGLIFIFLAGFGGYSLANSSFFDLKEIKVAGNEVLSQDELIQLSGLRIGINLLKVSRQQVAESVQSHPYVKEVDVRRSLPNKIEIRIAERSPMALISGDQRYLILDGEGYCIAEVGLATAESWTLPSIRCSSEAMDLLPGEKTENDGVLAALALIEKLDPFFLENILEFDAPSAEKLAVINIDGLPVYFGPPENLDRKLQYYEELLIKNKEQCNAQTLNYVDLRYDTQPILSRK
ncbi:MAG: FtsQ-type POTRA domain-containing protein [Clostridiales bacterium]